MAEEDSDMQGGPSKLVGKVEVGAVGNKKRDLFREEGEGKGEGEGEGVEVEKRANVLASFYTSLSLQLRTYSNQLL